MRDLFFKDWTWKLLSLFLAVTIWLTVERVLEPEKFSNATFNNVSLTYENLPVQLVSSAADASLYHVAPATVKVTIKGAQEMIDQLQATSVRAIVDFADTGTDGDLKRPVHVFVPPKVTLVSVDPLEITLIPPPKK